MGTAHKASMRLARRLAGRYLCRYGLPIMVVVGFLAGCLFYIAGTLQGIEFFFSVLLGVLILLVPFVYFAVRLHRYFALLRKQARLYGVTLCDGTPFCEGKTVKDVILTNVWMLRPGRLALHRKHITHAPVKEKWGGKGPVRYVLQLKTTDGGKLSVSFTKEQQARKLRAWVGN